MPAPPAPEKSTIVNLISRFYNVDSGRVLIDGQDISEVTIHSLRSQMGIMMQDSFNFLRNHRRQHPLRKTDCLRG